MNIIEEIKALESKSVEELYEILGEELLSTTLAAGEFSDEEKREEARTWEELQKLKLRKLICESNTYKVYVQDPNNWSWVILIATIADVISPIVLNVAPFACAALIVKKGLDNFCTESK